MLIVGPIDEIGDDQRGKKVTMKSLGIKESDTKEMMIGKILKKMQIGDYIENSELGFLPPAITDYIKRITKTSSNTYEIDGKSSWMVSAFKDGATMQITSSLLNTRSLKDEPGYKIVINGLTATAKYAGASPVSYVNDNIIYIYENNKWVIQLE